MTERLAATLDAPAKRSGKGSRWVVSFAVHLGIGVAVFSLRPQKRDEVIAISLAEAKAKPKPPVPAKETPRPPDEPAHAPRAAKMPQVPPRAAPHSQPAAAEPHAGSPGPDLDFGMGNGPGIPVSSPGSQGNGADAAPKTSASGAARAPSAAPSDDCADPPTKPKPKSVPQPAYPDAARAAGVSGKVRIEVTVDESGNVRDARVLAGLGSGLDEAAVAAARRASFSPATRCGRAVAGTFVIGMRFTL